MFARIIRLWRSPCSPGISGVGGSLIPDNRMHNIRDESGSLTGIRPDYRSLSCQSGSIVLECLLLEIDF
jgi:hypothetical protein